MSVDQKLCTDLSRSSKFRTGTFVVISLLARSHSQMIHRLSAGVTVKLSDAVTCVKDSSGTNCTLNLQHR